MSHGLCSGAHFRICSRHVAHVPDLVSALYGAMLPGGQRCHPCILEPPVWKSPQDHGPAGWSQGANIETRYRDYIGIMEKKNGN